LNSVLHFEPEQCHATSFYENFRSELQQTSCKSTLCWTSSIVNWFIQSYCSANKLALPKETSDKCEPRKSVATPSSPSMEAKAWWPSRGGKAPQLQPTALEKGLHERSTHDTSHLQQPPATLSVDESMKRRGQEPWLQSNTSNNRWKPLVSGSDNNRSATGQELA